jgi:hypothetical protein
LKDAERLELIKRLAKSAAPIGEQTNHTSEVQLGGRRSSKLRVIEPLQLPEGFELKPGRPPRSVCKDGPRPCPHIACPKHLWLRLQNENPGNPQAGKQGATTFHAATNVSCSQDLADAGPQSFETIGRVMGTDPTRERQVAKRALLKLQASGADVDEMLEAL